MTRTRKRRGRRAGDDGTIVRISDPGELAAAVPHLVGHRPHESVVLISLRGSSGKRVGMVARCDLVPPEHADALAAGMSRALLRDGPAAAVVVVCSEAADEPCVPVTAAGRDAGPLPGLDLPHRPLVRAMVGELADAGVPVGQALLVRGGRWWSYDCADDCCAPSAGTPLPSEPTPFETASVAAGRVALADRRALEGVLARPSLYVEAAAGVVWDTTAAGLARRVAREGLPAVAADSWVALRRALDRCRPGPRPGDPGPTDEELARVVCALEDPHLRDAALMLSLGPEAEAAEALWTECVRRSPVPWDARPAVLVAVCAWLRGDGGLASVALERALASVPDLPFALTLRTALDAAIPPDDLRELLALAALDPAPDPDDPDGWAASFEEDDEDEDLADLDELEAAFGDADEDEDLADLADLKAAFGDADEDDPVDQRALRAAMATIDRLFGHGGGGAA